MAHVGYNGIVYDFVCGEIVRVKTTNGGDIVGKIHANYRRTYDCVLVVNGQYVIIPATRIESVTYA